MDDKARPRLRRLIAELLGKKGDTAGFSDSDSLLQSGRLDSLAVTQIVTVLEQEFGVDFYAVEFDPDRLDSIEKIAAFVGAASGAP